jgi:hypothetical protein
VPSRDAMPALEWRTPPLLEQYLISLSDYNVNGWNRVLVLPFF